MGDRLEACLLLPRKHGRDQRWPSGPSQPRVLPWVAVAEGQPRGVKALCCCQEDRLGECSRPGLVLRYRGPFSAEGRRLQTRKRAGGFLLDEAILFAIGRDPIYHHLNGKEKVLEMKVSVGLCLQAWRDPGPETRTLRLRFPALLLFDLCSFPACSPRVNKNGQQRFQVSILSSEQLQDKT